MVTTPLLNGLVVSSNVKRDLGIVWIFLNLLPTMVNVRFFYFSENEKVMSLLIKQFIRHFIFLKNQPIKYVYNLINGIIMHIFMCIVYNVKSQFFHTKIPGELWLIKMYETLKYCMTQTPPFVIFCSVSNMFYFITILLLFLIIKSRYSPWTQTFTVVSCLQ